MEFLKQYKWPIIALVAVVAILYFAFGPARAADVPQYKPQTITAQAPYSWTGLYLGAHGGYGWSETDHATPSFGGGSSLSSSPSGDDFLYGVSGAALYQFPGTIVVAGIAADYSWGKLSGSSVISGNGPAFCPGPGCGPIAGTSYKVSLDEIGTAKGVLGLSMGRLLPYLSAGVAFAEGNATASGGGGSISASDDLTGWTVGGGALWALNDAFMLGVDYAYLRFDDGNYAFNVGGPIAITAGGKTEAHVVKAKALLKF
jgi:outer membrane immunogenic protein